MVVEVKMLGGGKRDITNTVLDLSAEVCLIRRQLQYAVSLDRLKINSTKTRL